MTESSGIDKLCPGAFIDAAAFTPCGYSMNAVKDDVYSTIHITPEAACSYVSFETNVQLNDYTCVVRDVLAIFRPKRFVLTMFWDECAIDILPTDVRAYIVPDHGPYLRSSATQTKVDIQRQYCFMACYSLVPFQFDAITTCVDQKQ
jgi:S-adenosylmethionine decarboxylase